MSLSLEGSRWTEGLETFTGNERLEAACVEAEGTEYVGEGAEGGGYLGRAVSEEPRRSVLCPGNGRIGSLIYFARRCASGLKTRILSVKHNYTGFFAQTFF